MRSPFAAVVVIVLGVSAARADDWPEFRGPTGQGHAKGSLPTEWGPDRNVAWKQDVPGEGWSSRYRRGTTPTGPAPRRLRSPHWSTAGGYRYRPGWVAGRERHPLATPAPAGPEQVAHAPSPLGRKLGTVRGSEHAALPVARQPPRRDGDADVVRLGRARRRV